MEQMRRNLFFNTAGSLLFYFCQSAITILVLGMDRGDMDWRNIVNPKHKLNH